jgi:hypothetical protein
LEYIHPIRHTLLIAAGRPVSVSLRSPPWCSSIVSIDDATANSTSHYPVLRMQFMKVETLECLVCHKQPARVRGLCDECLVKCARSISIGRSTWSELEQLGLALPLKSSSPAKP